MIRPAYLAIAGLCGLGFLAAFAVQAWAQGEIDRLAISVAQRSAMLATERGLLAERQHIEREYRSGHSIAGQGDRGQVIEVLRRMKGVTIQRLNIENEGRRVTIEISGGYADLISAAVGLPAQISGLTVERLVVSAGSGAHHRAVARVEGSFS